MKTAVFVAGVSVVAASGLSCGGGPSGPQCDTEDCSVPGNTIIKWEFNHQPEFNFPDDSCGDLKVATVHVDAVNPTDATANQSLDVPCGNGQATFVGLAPGNYNIVVAPEDGGGALLVTEPVTTQAPAAAANMTTTTQVEVPYTAWKGPYTGTFLFRLTWGGQSCADATPPVVSQTLKLTAGGAVVTKTSDGGQKLDGSAPGACQPSTSQFPDFVDQLPFGPATLEVTGEDGAGSAVFEQTFATFVGAAKNNPTLTFDVEPPADAGVDAPADAAPDAM